MRYPAVNTHSRSWQEVNLLRASRTSTTNKIPSQTCQLVLNQGNSIWFPHSLAFDFASFGTIPFSGLAFCFAWSPYLSHWPAQYFSIVPPPDSCSKAPNTHLPLLTRSAYHRSRARGMPAKLGYACQARLTPGSASRLTLSSNYKSHLQVPAPLVRPAMLPSTSKCWKREETSNVM